MISKHEADLLEVAAGMREPGPWGALVSVAIGFLVGDGLLSNGPAHWITEKGKRVLAEYQMKQRNEANAFMRLIMPWA